MVASRAEGTQWLRLMLRALVLVGSLLIAAELLPPDEVADTEAGQGPPPASPAR